MLFDDALTEKDLEETLAAAAAAMPAYAGLLALYGRVFKAQAAAAADGAGPQVVPIEAPRAAIGLREGFPLSTPADLPVDIGPATRLLARICQIVKGTTAQLEAAAGKIQAALDAGSLDPESLFRSRLSGDAQQMALLAASLDTEVELLGFFTDQSLAPSLDAHRRHLAGHLTDPDAWQRGFCPICGGPPALGAIGEGGQRHLYCGRCWHRWPVRRVHCAVCGQSDAQKLYYFYSDTEPAYRVDVCEGCRHYIKTVDLRCLQRRFYPPLEQALTVHLDLLAAEKGLAPAAGAGNLRSEI